MIVSTFAHYLCRLHQQTFRTLEAYKKHCARRPATDAFNEASPSQFKRPRVQELPKIVNAPSVIIIPDSRSATPYLEESGEDADEDDYGSDDDDSSGSACSWGVKGAVHMLE